MPTRPGYIWSGTEWVSIGQEAAVAPVSYQTSAPSTPSTGDIWIDSNDDVPGIDTSQFLRWRKTAAGSETSLSGNDDTGLALSYTPNYEQVYLNGVLLVRGQDYTATDGTSITGLTALATNDVVEVFGVVARVVGDVYTQAQTNSLLDAKSNVSTTGMVLLNSTTMTSGTASISIDNIFTSGYRNYKIIIDNFEATNVDAVFFRLRSNGTDFTGSNYQFQWVRANGGSWSSIARETVTYGRLGSIGTSGDKSSIVFEIQNPQVATWTTVLADNLFVYSSVGTCIEHNYSLVYNTSQYDGIKVYMAGTNFNSGNIKVYGYK